MRKFRCANRVIFIGGYNSPHPTLTLYKTYTVINTYVSGVFIDVADDIKSTLTYESKAFVKLSEYRKIKIKKICSKLVIK